MLALAPLLLALVAQVTDVPPLPPASASWPWWAQALWGLVPLLGGWLGVQRYRRRRGAATRAKPCPPAVKR